MTWIKVCGITSVEDARDAIEAGVSAIGLVFAASPRQVSLEDARDIAAAVRGRAEVVGVFKDPAGAEEMHARVGFDRIQIHHDARPRVAVPLLRSLPPSRLTGPTPSLEEGELLMIDGSEGRGHRADLSLVKEAIVRGAVLAGGLTPSNVTDVVTRHRPWGVDVSSGVEAGPGRKDAALVRAFVAAVRRAS